MSVTVPSATTPPVKTPAAASADAARSNFTENMNSFHCICYLHCTYLGLGSLEYVGTVRCCASGKRTGGSRCGLHGTGYMRAINRDAANIDAANIDSALRIAKGGHCSPGTI